MIPGVDAIGLGHKLFKTRIIIENVPRGFVIGAFDDGQTFGRCLKKLRKICATGKYCAIRIHAHWSDEHKIVPIKKLRKKLPQYEQLAKDFPDVAINVSHSCEHNEKNKAEVLKRIDLIRELAPSCYPVNSVWLGALIDGITNEKHGESAVLPGTFIASTDGCDLRTLDAERWKELHRSAYLAFGWTPPMNLRGGPDRNLPPKLRTMAPTAHDVREIVRLMS